MKDRDANDLLLHESVTYQLRGRVHMDSGQGTIPRDFRVFFSDPEIDSMMVGSAAPLPDGTFAFGVRSGPTLLRFGGGNGTYVQSIRLGGRELDNPFELLTGGNLEILIGADVGRLTVAAQDSAGKPVDRIWITIAPQGSRANRADLIQNGSPGPGGTFQFTNVAPGEYSVFAWECPMSPALRSPEFLKLFQNSAVNVTVPSSGQASVQVKAVSAQQIEETRWKVQ